MAFWKKKNTYRVFRCIKPILLVISHTRGLFILKNDKEFFRAEDESGKDYYTMVYKMYPKYFEEIT